MYIDINKLIKITGLTRQTIIKRAKKESWKTKEPLLRGRKTEFIISSLPEDIRKNIKNVNVSEMFSKDNQPPEINPNLFECIKQSFNSIDDIRKKDISKIIEIIIKKKSLVILGKSGIGKSHILNLLFDTIRKCTPNIVYFPEPPTPKTVETNLNMLEDKNLTFLFIDSLEHATPSLVKYIDSILDKVIFIGAGHLGGKQKKHLSTWFKCKAYFLQPLTREQSLKLINSSWEEGSYSHKKIIIDSCKGIPRDILNSCEMAKKGIMPEEEKKYFDFTPLLIVIATIGLALRVIGFGYVSPEAYVIGGVIGVTFWGAFWIFRGYISGWFGNYKAVDKKNA